MRWLQRRNISFDPIAFAIHESGNFKAKPVTARTMKLTARITCCSPLGEVHAQDGEVRGAVTGPDLFPE